MELYLLCLLHLPENGTLHSAELEEGWGGAMVEKFLLKIFARTVESINIDDHGGYGH